jgi:hypothetical protein
VAASVDWTDLPSNLADLLSSGADIGGGSLEDLLSVGADSIDTSDLGSNLAALMESGSAGGGFEDLASNVSTSDQIRSLASGALGSPGFTPASGLGSAGTTAAQALTPAVTSALKKLLAPGSKGGGTTTHNTLAAPARQQVRPSAVPMQPINPMAFAPMSVTQSPEPGGIFIQPQPRATGLQRLMAAQGG